MKKIVMLFIFLLNLTVINAQTVVVNEKLQYQLAKNQAVRSASNESFFKSYEKQRALYDTINKKLAQAVIIQEHIYRQLTNVNKSFSQGRKIKYIYEYAGRTLKNMEELRRETLKKPEYAILYTKGYGWVVQEIMTINDEINQEILREDKNYLMDYMDREIALEKVFQKIRKINVFTLSVSSALKRANKIPYINQIPVFGDWVVKDKMIAKDIIDKYKRHF